MTKEIQRMITYIQDHLKASRLPKVRESDLANVTTALIDYYDNVPLDLVESTTEKTTCTLSLFNRGEARNG